jgi:F0F1-type ATP synthase assembly protein I
MPDDRPSTGPSAPIGFLIAGSEMVSFALLGLLLDYAFDTMPWLTIVLTLLGLVAAFTQLTRMAKTLAGKKGQKPDAPPTQDGGAT